MTGSAPPEGPDRSIERQTEREAHDEIDHWDVVPTAGPDSEHRVFLPTDEELLKKDAFVIVPRSLLRRLDECR